MAPQDPPRDRICGIILAAGSSTRMGRLKQLLPIGGTPLLQRFVDEAALADFAELVVVLGHAADDVRNAVQLPPRARFVVNSDYARGMGTSLAAGLRAASADATAAAVLLGDQPGVSAPGINAVIAAFNASEEPMARPVYVAANGERVPGHPVIIARRVWPLAADLRGDEGLRSIIARHPTWLQEVEMRGPPPSDIDTPEDYERVLAGGPEDPV